MPSTRLDLILRGRDRTGGAFRSARGNVRGLARQMQSARRVVTGFFAAFAVQRAVRAFASLSDEMTRMRTRLRLVTSGTADLNRVQRQLFELSQNTRTEFSATVELYARVARSAQNLGIAQESVLRFTELVQKSIQISGATANEAAAGAIQLAQGIASNRLAGEELRSVLEQMPRVAQAIASGIGVSIGELRDLAKNGQLTGETVINAMLRAGQAIDTEFEGVTRTIEQAFTQLENEFLLAIQNVNDGSTLMQTFVDVLDELRDIVKDPSFQDGMRLIADVIGFIVVNTARAISLLGDLVNSVKSLGNIFSGDLAGVTASLNFDPGGTRELEDALSRFENRGASSNNVTGSGVPLIPGPINLPSASGGRSRSRRTADDVLRGIERRITAIDNETLSINLSAGATARMEEAQRAMNTIRDNDITLTEAQSETLEAYLDNIESSTDSLGAMSEELKDLDRIGEAVTSNLESAFSDWVESGKLNVKDMIDSMLKDLARLAFSKSLERILGSFGGGGNVPSGILGSIGGALSGQRRSGGLLGGLFGGSSGSRNPIANTGGGGILGDPAGLLRGGGGGLLGSLFKFAGGGIVSGPTLFPMANGAGLMGEAGPEAIMPLSRNSRGQLGVIAQGMAGQGKNQELVIKLVDGDGNSVEAKETRKAGGLQLEVLIDNIVGGKVGERGSKTRTALQSSFGLSGQLGSR